VKGTFRLILMLACLLPAIGLSGCGGVSEQEGEQIYEHVLAENAELIARYCIYGSHSKAQYVGCVRHVSWRYVEHSHSNAAEWAKGYRETCGYDAGPQCGNAAARRIEEETAAALGR